MSAATRATTARQRATIALEMIARYRGGYVSRAFDDCFEMNDGEEVKREGMKSIRRSRRYLLAILRTEHTDIGIIPWTEYAKQLLKEEQHAGTDP